MKRESVFSLRAETAIFAHGSRGPEFSELRASAVRGAMRYWFRALAGTRLDEPGLRRCEELVFGSAQAGIGVGVRVVWSEPYKDISDRSRTVLPHKNNPPQALQGVSSINPQTEFRIELRAQQRPEVPLVQFECAVWSLWLALSFGGLGSRARRGAGSVSIIDVSAQFPLPLLTPPVAGAQAPLAELKKTLEDGLRESKRAFRELAHWAGIHELAQPVLEFPAMREASAQCALEQLDAVDEAQARAQVMLKLREYKNPAFGLPLLFKGQVVQKKSSRRGEFSRHSSPLWIRLLPCAGKWAAVYTVLPPFPRSPGADSSKVAEFLTSGAKVQVELPG